MQDGILNSTLASEMGSSGSRYMFELVINNFLSLHSSQTMPLPNLKQSFVTAAVMVVGRAESAVEHAE